ncbi:MAG: carbohydrate binding family 9 domain-containing protein [Bacteroidales bacterium]|nr:carbohydrate binding family 9 domain-containing protein [Bacteroidales bacterium]
MRISITIILFILSINIFAQGKRVYNTTRISIEPKIDGILNDAAWQGDNWQGDFTQREPHDGAKPSQKTTFKVLFTDDFIYVAVKSFDTQADSIDSRLTRRDNDEGDLVGVHFDSYHDLRTSFSFMVNAAGVKSDVLYSNNGDSEDQNWNPIWYVKTTKDTKGWYAEIKIPLSQLRFSKKDNKVWGFNVARYIYRNEELSFWNPIPTTASGWVYDYGELHGIANLKPKRILEIAPYVSLGIETSEKETGNPYATGSELLYGIGLDGKIGLTNDFVLDFTFNPDFGQVESDPSEMNLTAFETYQQEQRPFFIEGSNILDFEVNPGNHDQDNLFYSRRVGRIPQHYPAITANEYINFPMFTKILGALKVSGKTKNGLSVGIMESITREEKATISLKGEERKETVEPLTNYFVARVQKDFNKGNSILGGEITSTNRNIKNNDLLFLPKNAFSGGLDFTQYWKDRKYFLRVNAVASNINGDSLAMIDRQTASQRYYQRPDATYLKLDSSITSLSGYGGNFSLGKSVSKGLSYDVNLSWRSPGLSLNDIGYLRNADKLVQSASVNYAITEPKSFYRSIEMGLVQWQAWDFGTNPIFSGGFAYANITFKNQYSLSLQSNIDYNLHDNNKLRGGPSFYEPGSAYIRFNIETNQTKKFYLDFGSRQQWGQYGASRVNAWDAGFTYRPIDAVSFAFHPNIYFTSNDLQYIDESSFNGEARYILGQIDQTTLRLRLYLNVNITPDLTIQYFGAPFFSSGKFTNFKRVDQASASDYNARTHEFTSNEIVFNNTSNTYDIDENQDGTIDYSIGNPNFNFKQFQSNLVIRWEFIPGSMVYLVWTQNKTNYDGLGTFDFSDDMNQLFSTIPTNVFMVKLSYRFY